MFSSAIGKSIFVYQQPDARIIRIDIVYTRPVSSVSGCRLHLTRNQIQMGWTKGPNKSAKPSSLVRRTCEVFFDPFLRVVDAGIVEGEQREAVEGMTVTWRLLSVVYIEESDAIRIISARTVEKAERQSYEDQ